MDVAYPYERHRVAPRRPPTAPDLADRDRADLWLDTELANLLAAAQHAATHGWPEHTWRLSATLDWHLRMRGRNRDAEPLHQHAIDAARHLGNDQAEMNALNSLGYVHRLVGRMSRPATTSSGPCRSPRPPATAAANWTR